jgi:hypothetical protein
MKARILRIRCDADVARLIPKALRKGGPAHKNPNRLGNTALRAYLVPLFAPSPAESVPVNGGAK